MFRPHVNSIDIVEYNLEWPQMFEQEAQKIKGALGANCLAIHHIGSTSVPGLPAKPIIDIIPEVFDITVIDQCNRQMMALGYVPQGEYGIPFRRYFQKGEDLRTHNVHVFEKGSSEIDRHLRFRNWMISHDEDRRNYAELKQRLACDFPNDIFSYCLGKEEFIAHIDAKAGWNGVRIVIALTPKEWEAYHRIRMTQIFAPIHIVYDREHPTLTADNHFHFVLYKAQDIVAVAHVEFVNTYEAAIRSLATDEIYKCKGFGTTMVRLIEKWVKHQKRNIIKAHVALTAEAFYRKLGYIDVPFDELSISNSKDIIKLGKVL